jgi:hypothetical protein
VVPRSGMPMGGFATHARLLARLWPQGRDDVAARHSPSPPHTHHLALYAPAPVSFCASVLTALLGLAAVSGLGSRENSVQRRVSQQSDQARQTPPPPSRLHSRAHWQARRRGRVRVWQKDWIVTAGRAGRRSRRWSAPLVAPRRAPRVRLPAARAAASPCACPWARARSPTASCQTSAPLARFSAAGGAGASRPAGGAGGRRRQRGRQRGRSPLGPPLSQLHGLSRTVSRLLLRQVGRQHVLVLLHDARVVVQLRRARRRARCSGRARCGGRRRGRRRRRSACGGGSACRVSMQLVRSAACASAQRCARGRPPPSRGQMPTPASSERIARAAPAPTALLRLFTCLRPLRTPAGPRGLRASFFSRAGRTG